MLDDEQTTGREYTERLVAISDAGWKFRLRAVDPYLWNIRRLLGGRATLEVGCGIGRVLRALGPGSLGVDHNEHSVTHCRRLGLSAMTSAEFHASARGPFDALLLSHVVEHLEPGHEADVLREYLPAISSGSPVVLICPQERGFASDPTHTTFFDLDRLGRLCEEVGLVVRDARSFPLPRRAGRLFVYNEFVVHAALS